MPSEDEVLSQLEVRVKKTLGSDPSASDRYIVLKKGPRAYKVATLRSFQSAKDGRVVKREFRVQTFNRSNLRGFTDPERAWSCENEEVEALRTFLESSLSGVGRYRLVRSGTDIDVLIEQVRNNDVSSSSIARLLEATKGTEGIVEALAKSDYGALVAEAVGLHRRRQGLVALRDVVEDPTKTEHDIRKALIGQTWIFGGRYAGEAHRKAISPDDIVDIPLIRNDGAIHVVELKQANVAGLIDAQRSHPTVGSPVHHATLQAANYLKTLDEDANQNYSRYRIECRRSSATVLIGHSKFVKGFDREDIAAAFRTYNALISRIEVLTYDELLASAENSLDVAEGLERVKVASAEETDLPDDDVPF